MKLKRLTTLSAALVLSIASLLTFASPEIAHATPLTCNWTGAGDGTTFSDATNWTNCNSLAPVAGSVLNFGVIGSSSQTYTLTNDLGVSFSGITYGDSSKTNSIFSSYNIDTLDLAANSLMAGTFGSDSLENVSVSVGSLQLDGGISIYNYAIVPTDSNNGLTATPTDLTLNGNIDINPANYNSSPILFNPTGNVTINNGAEFGYQSDTASSVTVQNSATLELGAVPTVSAPITLGDGSGSDNPLIEYDISTANAVTISGPITLTHNISVDIPWDATLTITGAISGNYTITKTDGSTGTLVINSSDNQSATPNTADAAAASAKTKLKAPNTGLAAIATNPFAVLLATSGSAIVLVAVAHRLKNQYK